MKNLTLSADEERIERARARARHETSLKAAADYRALMQRLEHVRSGGLYSRQELNER